MISTTETWRAIPGYEGFYEVSDLGNVRSCERRLTLKNGRPYTVKAKVIALIRSGHCLRYRTVALWREGTRTMMNVHQAVMLAFVGPPGLNEEVSHEPDPDPSNNTLSNLKYRSRQWNLFERDARLSGMSYAEVCALLERQPGQDDSEVSDAPDPALTGETPF